MSRLAAFGAVARGPKPRGRLNETYAKRHDPDRVRDRAGRGRPVRLHRYEAGPDVSEFYAVKQALKGLAAEPGIANQDPAKIQDLFFRRLYISYAEDVKPEHVKITRGTNGWVMVVNYEVRKPVIANLDVIGKFSATEDLNRRGGDE